MGLVRRRMRSRGPPPQPQPQPQVTAGSGAVPGPTHPGGGGGDPSAGNCVVRTGICLMSEQESGLIIVYNFQSLSKQGGYHASENHLQADAFSSHKKHASCTSGLIEPRLQAGNSAVHSFCKLAGSRLCQPPAKKKNTKKERKWCIRDLQTYLHRQGCHRDGQASLSLLSQTRWMQDWRYLTVCTPPHQWEVSALWLRVT